MPTRLEDLIQAVRWKLGLPGGGERPEEMKRIWADLERDPARLKAVATQVSNHIGRLLYFAVLGRLTGEPPGQNEWAAGVADLFVKWAADNERSVSPKLAGLLRAALEAKPAPGQTPAVPRPAPAPPTGLHPGAGRPAGPPPLPTQPPPLPRNPPPCRRSPSGPAQRRRPTSRYNSAGASPPRPSPRRPSRAD